MTSPSYRHDDTGDKIPTPEVEQIITMAREGVHPHELKDGGIYAVLVGGSVQLLKTPGYKDRHRDERADMPRRTIRSTAVRDVDSFLAYLARYLEEDGSYSDAGALEVWADIDADKITGILDGHYGWLQHRCVLELKKSREWAEWMSVDGKLFKQDTFAQFVEDHLSTIAVPDGALLLDICQTLEGSKSAAFKMETILANGQRKFRYEETVEARAGHKGDLTIPGELTLVLRPFQGSDPVPVTARFRYRIEQGALALGVKLSEPDKALEDAFARIVDLIGDALPVHVHHGRP